MQRGAANAEGLGGRRDIAAGAKQRPLQHRALAAGKVIACGIAAEKVGGRHRLQGPSGRNSERHPGGAGRADHEIVRIHRNETAATSVRSLRQHDAGIGKSLSKQVGLDTLGGLAHASAIRLAKASVRSARQEETSSTPASAASWS